MTTVILRVHQDTKGELKGTMERPGGQSQVFRDVEELIAVLSTWVEGEKTEKTQKGKAWGSTSSSVIRDT